MSAVFKEKKSFDKAIKIIDTHEDFDLPQQHKIAFSADPSRKVVAKIFRIIGTSKEELDKMEEEELEKMNADFYEAVSQIVVDTDIAEISFNTPEEAEAAFESEYIDWNFLFDVITHYVSDILSEARGLKKILNGTGTTKDSGKKPEKEGKK